MDRKIIKQVQSVLVPRGHFRTAEEASLHVQKMGFNPHYKEPHITDNYYRFRQQPVREGGEYKTGRIDGDKVVFMKGKGVAILHPHMHTIHTGGGATTKVFKHPHHFIHGAHKKDITAYAFENKLEPEGQVHADHYKRQQHEHYKQQVQRIASEITKQNRHNESQAQHKKILGQARKKHIAHQ